MSDEEKVSGGPSEAEWTDPEEFRFPENEDEFQEMSDTWLVWEAEQRSTRNKRKGLEWQVQQLRWYYRSLLSKSRSETKLVIISQQI